MIYVFGDSHVGVFRGTNDLLGEGAKYIDDFYAITPPNTTAMLSFGEIDCRMYLSQKLNIKETVDNYFKFIDMARMTNNIILYLPPASSSMDKNCEGTEEERNQVTLEFTNECKKRADRVGILYISILEELMHNLKTDMSYYVIREEDSIHLNQKVIPLLLKEFEKHEI